MKTQPWIHSGLVDGIFILGPAFFVTSAVFLFPHFFAQFSRVPGWAWAVLILGVDVAHVYATLFRTYFDPSELKKNSGLYSMIPVLGWMGGTVLYGLDPLFFWRVLAYLAVFHFIRQQYGFAMIYSRHDSALAKRFVSLNRLTIYSATLYPLLFWHTHLPRNFNWFVEGDFFQVSAPEVLNQLALSAYVLILIAYFAKEILLAAKGEKLNVPRNILVLGTALSWYIGIIKSNNDLVFTATNVIAHGVPYMALVWIYGMKTKSSLQIGQTTPSRLQSMFQTRFIPLFLFFLVFAAFLEEGLWDGFVWRDHPRLFSAFQSFPHVSDASTLTWLVPLLALPQITHYLLDAFIWRLRGTQGEWQLRTFRTENSMIEVTQ